MDEKTTGEQRLVQLVEEGLASPIEPDDTTFWQKRREALRQAIDAKRDVRRVKPSS